jgi:hypothetical protein
VNHDGAPQHISGPANVLDAGRHRPAVGGPGSGETGKP